MSYPLCRHIRTSGIQCHSPALTAGLYCFFHARFYQRHSAFRHNPCALPPGQHIQLHPIEDAESVQLAISAVVNSLAGGQLDTRRGTAILYGLALAASNVRRLKTPYFKEVVRDVAQSPEGQDIAEPALPPQTN